MSHVGLTCSGCFMEEKKLVSKLAGTVTSVRASVSSAVGTDRLQDRQTTSTGLPCPEVVGLLGAQMCLWPLSLDRARTSGHLVPKIKTRS